MAITNDDFCYTVMEELASVAGQNGDPMRNRQVTGLLDALVSPDNTMGMEVDRLYDQGNGKERKVILKYLQPDSYSDVTTVATSICDAEGEATAYQYDEVSIDMVAQAPIKKLTNAQHRELCETGNEFRAKIIRGMINATIKNINRQLVAPFYVGAGGILGGSGAKNTVYDLLYNNGIVEVNPNGFFDMIQDLTDTGVVGTPIVVGGGAIKRYADLQNIACCNAYGSDPSQMGEINLYYDNDIIPVLGTVSNEDDPFFVFAPGAAQFVDKPLNLGEFRLVEPLLVYDTITDPVTGLTFDFEMRRDCNLDWTWMLRSNFGLWQLPTDLFKNGDDRDGINFNWAFRANTVAAA